MNKETNQEKVIEDFMSNNDEISKLLGEALNQELPENLEETTKNHILKLMREEKAKNKTVKSWYIPASIAASIVIVYSIFPGRFMITSLDQTENETQFVRKYDDIDPKYKIVKSPALETAITYSDYRLLEEINRLWADGEKNKAVNKLRTFIKENPDYPKEEIKEILHEEIKLSDYIN